MSGIADSVGASLPVNIDGEDVLLRPLELSDLGAVENELRTMRPNILKDATEAAQAIADASERAAFMDRAWKEARAAIVVTPEEVLRYITETLPGLALSTWLALDKHYPGRFTRKHVYDWLEQLAKENASEYEAFRRRRDIASGLAPEVSPTNQDKPTDSRG